MTNEKNIGTEIQNIDNNMMSVPNGKHCINDFKHNEVNEVVKIDNNDNNDIELSNYY